MSNNALSNPNGNTGSGSDATSFLALQGFSLADALSEEMVGMNVTFDRIKMPIGGITVFEVPGDAPGETDAVKEFRGVILYHHPLLSYYRKGYSGGKDLPDCGSNDGLTGVGDPGGNCSTCPLNQFKSGKNGGKACKSKRRIYILREGELIPVLLTIPNGSMNEFTMYVKHLLTKGGKSGAVVTRFSLKKAENSGGVAFSQAQFSLARPLTAEELPYIAAMAEQVKQFATHVLYEDDESDSAMVVDPETGEILES